MPSLATAAFAQALRRSLNNRKISAALQGKASRVRAHADTWLERLDGPVRLQVLALTSLVQAGAQLALAVTEQNEALLADAAAIFVEADVLEAAGDSPGAQAKVADASAKVVEADALEQTLNGIAGQINERITEFKAVIPGGG